MNITNLFKVARELEAKEMHDKEAIKVGNLRVGSSGIMSPTGEIAGGCIRRGHIRQLGMEVELKGENTMLMFDLGFANEEVIVNKLKKSLGEGYTILCEEEIPVEWTTSNGTKVTGRPDIVVFKGASPEVGIELKSVHSMWVARGVLFEKKPKLSNVIQAAHYMHLLNVPYKLVYTSYSTLGQGMTGTASSSSWIPKMFPRPGEAGSEHMEYTFYRKDTNSKGKPKNIKVSEEEWKSLPYKDRDYSIKSIKQFQIVYDLRFHSEGRVQFKEESSDVWTDTIVTREGITGYFEKASKITEGLPPRPTSVDLVGGDGGYSDCDYCPLKEVCDSHEESGYSKWLSEVQKISSSLANKKPKI